MGAYHAHRARSDDFGPVDFLLNQKGSAGLIVIGDHNPSAARLLSERLQFPLHT